MSKVYLTAIFYHIPVEQGLIYIFLGQNGTFPEGNVTLQCQPTSQITPCPEQKVGLIKL